MHWGSRAAAVCITLMDFAGNVHEWMWFAIAVAVFAIGVALYLYKRALSRRAEKRRLIVARKAADLATENRRAARRKAIRDAERIAAAQRVEHDRLEAERIERADAKTRRLAQIEEDRVRAANAAFDVAAQAAQVQRKRFADAREEAIRKARTAPPPPVRNDMANSGPAPLGAPERPVVLLQPLRPTKTPAQTLVLVADDSKVVRVKTGRLLGEHHYKVIFATDGLDAVQLLQTNPPDVVITDVEMPGLDGFQLARHIRGNPKTAALPIIMITAAEERHRSDATKAGVNAVLGKPFVDDDLLSFVRAAMTPTTRSAAHRIEAEREAPTDGSLCQRLSR